MRQQHLAHADVLTDAASLGTRIQTVYEHEAQAIIQDNYVYLLACAF